MSSIVVAIAVALTPMMIPSNKVRLGDRWRVRPPIPGLGDRDNTGSIAPAPLARIHSLAAKDVSAAP